LRTKPESTHHLLHGPDEAGGVPQIPQNFNNHLAGPDTHAVHADPQPDRDEYGGGNGGGWQSNEADTGEHQDGTGGGRDESGSYIDQNGGDDTTGHDAYEGADSEGQSTPVPVGPGHPIHLPGARVLEYFRRGGTDIALMSREIMGHLGENAETAMNITVREAIRTRGQDAERVIMKELNQMLTKRVWTPVDGRKLTAEQRGQIIRSSMFLKEKYLASGEFEKLKARLVAG
jgi:hypothetical protein